MIEIFFILFLGSKGYYSTFQGLSLVYLSGYEGAGKNDDLSASSAKKLKSDEEKSTLVEFSPNDVSNLISSCEKRHGGDCIDLLLTNQWPKYIENLSQQQLVGIEFK